MEHTIGCIYIYTIDSPFTLITSSFNSLSCPDGLPFIICQLCAAATGFLQELWREREVIIFDNPGIGNSTLPEDVGTAGLSIQRMADITLDFIQALGLSQPPVLVG
jgi:pimeloyl-ACP methyl ester carboxylesterase